MRKIMSAVLFAGMMFLLMGPATAAAEVNINIGIGAPLPPLIIPAPPPMVFIPGAYAYFADNVDVDIIFYQGYWYRPHGGRWYRSTDYNGQWVYITPSRVPSVLVKLPPNYKHVPPGYAHISHGDLKKNWRKWEKEKHWDKHKDKDYRREKGDHGKWDNKHGKGKKKHDD